MFPVILLRIPCSSHSWLHSTIQIYRIEVRTFGEHLHIFRIVLVYLTALKYLQTDRSILVICEERTAAGFTDILYHTAHTHRSVEFTLQINDEFSVLEFFDIIFTTTKITLNESDNLFQFIMIIRTRIKCLQIPESLIL